MKKIFLLLPAFLLLGFGLQAQSGVPAAAKNDLTERFPDAENVRWEKEGNKYEAEFKENGRAVEVIYDASGNWVASMRRIGKEDLPESVTTMIAGKFQGYKISEAFDYENASGDKKYAVEVYNPEKRDEVELIFNGSGKVISMERESDDDDGDDDEDDDDDDFEDADGDGIDD